MKLRKWERLTIKQIMAEEIVDKEVTVKGFIRSVRKSKKFSFLNMNDGTTVKNLQIIADLSLPNYSEVSTLLAGSAVAMTGKLVKSGGKGQAVEMQASKVEIFGTVDDSYPLQKKEMSMEFLRENSHLRGRTNTFGAIYRIRHRLSLATHEFFDSLGFYYIHTPIITAQDGEGAGDLFHVTAFDMENMPKNEKGGIDFTKGYFGKQAHLAVTGQLEAECAAMALTAVYTFGPTFRAENSNTSRHLSEFWMIEPEIAFAQLEEVADIAARYSKHLIRVALEQCREDLEFLVGRYLDDPEAHFKTLQNVVDTEFSTLTFYDAMKILVDSGQKFEYPVGPEHELQTEHERFLAEKYFNGPVIVTDYPKDCKAFYMKQNDDGKTVRAMDVLFPGIGELIGGSQREHDYDKLLKRAQELGMNTESLWWYLDLRKFGTNPHGGFGLGFARAIMYITGISNIRDVIPFPRVPRNVEF